MVATLPLLKDFAQVLGDDRVEVTTLLTGLESEHTYTPKTKDILAVRKARLLVKVGLGLESWVDSLIRNADNPKLVVITTSEGIPLIADAETSDHDSQDGEHAHVTGNPHIWLDPVHAKTMVRHILEGLLQVDPSGREVYLKNYSDYIQKLDRLVAEGIKKMENLEDRRIITHHAAWPYFAKRFGLVIEGNLISQVGSEPSAKQLATLVQKIRQEQIKVIVSEPQLNPKLPQIVSQESGARVVVLTPLPGAIPGTETYLSMIEYNINQLVNALKN